jgi:hypothetical protein
MFDQLPPHDVAAEEAVLGSLMVADDVAALVACAGVTTTAAKRNDFSGTMRA